jgi:hypothetical protein
MENDKTIKPTGCCEPFNPEPWEDKEIKWENKMFIKDHVTSFLHIPLDMENFIGHRNIYWPSTYSAGNFCDK